MEELIYVDMDNVLCDYNTAHRMDLMKEPNIKYPQSQYGFFSGLAPLDGAIDGFNYLFDNYNTWILTAPSVLNPLSYTEKRIWVEQHLGMRAVHKLIMSPDKSLLIGDFLIDDITEGYGQENFKGKLIHFGSSNFPNWDVVTNFFTK